MLVPRGLGQPDLLAKWSKASIPICGEVHWSLGAVGINFVGIDLDDVGKRPIAVNLAKWIHEHHLDVEINVAGWLQGYVLKVNTNLPVLRRHSGSIGWIKRTLVDLVQIGLQLLLACRVHVSAIEPVCTVIPGRNDVVTAISLVTTDLNLVHIESNSLANCNKVASQCGHKEAVVGVGNILDELDVSEWGV